jgi:predicted PurR-regulated permease PerM
MMNNKAAPAGRGSPNIGGYEGSAATSVPSQSGIEAEAQWTAGRILLGTLTVMGVGLGFLMLYRFYMVVFLFFAAYAVQVALEPVVLWLRRRHIRRGISVILVFIVLALLIGALLWLLAPPIIEQGRNVSESLPQYYTDAREYLMSSRVGILRGLARALPSQISLPILAASAPEAAEGTAPVSTWDQVGLGLQAGFAFIAVFILVYYWTLEGELITRKFLMRVPANKREAARDLLGEINEKIGGYFRGQAILCVMVGVASAAAFFVIGAPNALLLGVIMGIFEAIPVIGPTLGAVPALLMTLAVSPDKTLWVLVAIVAIQVLENNLLVPKVMDESVGVNAVVSMLAIAAFGALFGIVGAILAIPLAAILQILLFRLLFRDEAAEEGTADTVTAPIASRSRIGVLRMEARDLGLDARRRQRDEGGEVDNGEDEDDDTADEIELIAKDLDEYLARLEARAEAEATTPVRGTR